MIHYSITPMNPGSHLLRVEIHVQNTSHDKLTLKMPRWIPGSYKIRDYAKFVSNLLVRNKGKNIACNQIGTNLWKANINQNDIIITYDVYAYDLSVRGCYFDQDRLFLNFCCICFDVVEFSNSPRTIEFNLPKPADIFTALPKKGSIYHAESYWHQIDCPVEIVEKSQSITTMVNDYKHHLVFSGWLDDNYDLEYLAKSIQSICKVQMQLFSGSPLTQDYTFMTYLEPKQYGGLEHSHSTALMAFPEMIKKKGESLKEAHIDYLGLCSHEYFHLWNIKRLRPKDLMPYDLDQEQPTEMLWMFEGFTSYYDELMLLRAGLINSDKFLERQAKNITRVLSVFARKIQTVAESSFNAWTKLYQADENANNIFISYYVKGAYVALYFDLCIRKYSNNEASLDNVMQSLWTNYGQPEIGVTEQSVLLACLDLLPKESHELFKTVFHQGIHGYDDFDFEALFKEFGVNYQLDAEKSGLQVKTSYPGFDYQLVEQKMIIKYVDPRSAASQNGLSVKDEIIAVNRVAVRDTSPDQMLYQKQAGESLVLTLNRRGVLFDVSIELTEAVKNQVSLKLNNSNSLSENWLATWL